MDPSAPGLVAIGVLRRNSSIATPVYVWIDLGTGAAWVDFATLTAAQFSAWVDAVTGRTGDPSQPPWPKQLNLTVSRTNDW